MACLSRELGNVYEALQLDKSVRAFPTLAARIVLDGGTVEFLDGDAGRINRGWIQEVVRRMELLLRAERGGDHPVRFSIRTVFGVQSSGKSTILNVMYGARLRTSAGMCTRGINMFAVPCFRPDAPFDLLIGLDTEGVCSPDQMKEDEKHALRSTNRMALCVVDLLGCACA